MFVHMDANIWNSQNPIKVFIPESPKFELSIKSIKTKCLVHLLLRIPSITNFEVNPLTE